jgi:hypothetical protein
MSSAGTPQGALLALIGDSADSEILTVWKVN